MKTAPRVTLYAANRREAFEKMTEKSENLTGNKPKCSSSFKKYIISQYNIDERYRIYNMKVVDGEWVRTFVFKWYLDC